MTPLPGASARPGPAPHILDLLDEGVFLVGPENRIVWINRALQHSLGVDRDALFGSDAGEFVNGFLLPRIVEKECREAISASLRDRAELPALDCTIRTPGGRDRQIRYSSRVGSDGMQLVRLQDRRPDGEQEMLETILSYLPETVNILDSDLRYVHVDREFARNLGREPHEMVGKTWEELGFSLEGAGPYFEKVREVFATGRQVRGEVRHAVIQDVGYSEYISVPIPGPSGRVERVLTVSRDITDRKRAERRMAHEHELLQTIIDAIPVMITIYDPNLKTFRFNRALRETLGWTEEDARGGGLMALCYPDPEYREMVGRFMQSLEPGWRDFVLRAKDGSFVESSWANIRLSDDTRVGIGIDIRERKAGERALRESEEWFRGIYERAGIGIALVGLDGRIIDSNPAFQEMLGYGPDELSRIHFAEITYPADLAEDMALAASLIAGEIESYRLEKRYVRRDGRILWGMLTTSLVRDAEGGPQFLIGMIEKITERKEAEAALQERTEELTRVNRELDEAHREANLYLDILTHDVRNANNVSTMYAGLLLDLLEGDLKMYAQKLHDSIWRSTEILKNVATIRRIHLESAGLSPVDLDAVIQEEIGNFPGASIRYVGLPVEVSADGLLPMVFTNLIGNAVKFGGPDVEITIRVEERDDEVLVSVEDTGPGIPDEVKRLLFRRFERGLGHGRGEGLGLYIVRKLVERYGGRVRVEDRVPGTTEAGAAFVFTLMKAGEAKPAHGREYVSPSAGEKDPATRPDTECRYFRSIVESAEDAILVTGDAGDMIDANPAACTQLGYTREELLQRSVFEICVDWEAGREFWQGFLKKGRLSGEHEIERKDGTTFRTECSAVANVAPGIHLFTIRPVTETQMEETLQFERDQLLSIFDGLEEIVYVTDPATDEILYANPFFTKALGKDVVGGVCYREFQGRDAPCPFCTNEIILRQKPEPCRWEYYNPTLDTHLDIVDRIIRWPDGRDVRLEVAIDITERKRAELALQESEERFRSIFEEAGIGIVLLDLDWRIMRTNPAFRRMVGCGEDELVGRSVAEITHPDDVEMNRALFYEMVTGRRSRFQLEKRYIGKDDRFGWVRLTSTLLRDAKGVPRFAVSMVEDISDRKMVEALRSEAVNRIERNIEQFAVLADHVRQPLQVLLARADLMDDEETAEKVREQVQRIDGYIKDLDRGWIESRKVREFLRRHEMT
ncbi:MAG: PAS domain S-box protein [Methanoculleus sp.]|nr:PAS domain S-box protein [Methanoculleus sp.]